MKRVVITGGPGSGKSTLINELERRGFACSHEVSRELIIEQAARENGCLPWLDLPGFAELALERMIRSYNEMREATTFYDRGLPDIVAYLKTSDLEVPGHFTRAVDEHRYEDQVFILPAWEEIYVNDSERWQSYAEAARLYEQISKTYSESGYQLVEVPKLSVKDRADFLISKLYAS